MKMKKFLSSLVALAMTMSMACTTTFAADESNNKQNIYNIHADDVIFSSNHVTNTSELQLYEASNVEWTGKFSTITAKSNPYVEVNATLSIPDNDFAAYIAPVYTYDYDNLNNVEELVVIVGGLSKGDLIVVVITNGNDEEVTNFVVDGNSTSSSGVVFTVDGTGKSTTADYKVYLLLPEGYNTEVNYTLQVASRYVHAIRQFYSRTTSIKFSGYDNWSSPGNMYISESDVPRSAIIDSLFVNGTLIDTKNGKSGYTCTIRLQNGTKEIAGNCPSIMKNLSYKNIPLVGTWQIIYCPNLYSSDPHTLNNFSATIDYTYDILNV